MVVAGKGKPEKVVYETSSVGSAVKMLREEFDLQVCLWATQFVRLSISVLAMQGVRGREVLGERGKQ